MACAPARAIAAIRVVLNILVLFLFCLILINFCLGLSFNVGNKVCVRSNNERFFQSIHSRSRSHDYQKLKSH